MSTVLSAKNAITADSSGSDRPLPLPRSEELALLLPSLEHRTIYELLYARRTHPPTMAEIRAHVEQRLEQAHEQTDRRTRDLRRYFVVNVANIKQETGGRAEARYQLVGWRPDAGGGERRGLSAKLEAMVFERDGCRCVMCGRSPREDQVKLVVDHRIPVHWGGTDDLENLQALCTEHNHGKQAHFASFDKYGPAICAAISYDQVHRRIGELLKSMEGQDVPVDVLNLVAREENKGDPTRRLRELRALGWQISVRKQREGKRTLSYYRLVESAEWPSEGPRIAVSRMEAERKRRSRRL